MNCRMGEIAEIKCYLKGTGFVDVAPVCLGYHECPAGHIGPGMRPYHLVHYVESGCGILIKDGREIPVSAGEAFVIRRREDATYIADRDNPWTYTWIGFNGVQAERLFSLSSSVVKCGAAPFELIRRIPNAVTGREELAAAAVMMLLSELPTDNAEKHDHVTEACRIIESMYMTEISVAEIAERIGLDRRYLWRIFREKTGMTIMDYVIKTRMEAAYGLLLLNMPVFRVAELVGYFDQFYFSKSFKKYFGLPPSEVRRKKHNSGAV